MTNLGARYEIDWSKENAMEGFLGNPGFSGDLVDKMPCNVDEKHNAENQEHGFHNVHEFDFHVSDIVWGKVRKYLWWPGQILDPGDAPDNHMNLKKKDCFYIKYFGQNRFGWVEASCMKPFGMFFLEMEKKSNLKTFHHALDCALDEVSRRVEFGLACSCLSKDVYAKLKSPGVVDSGIKRRTSETDSFVPSKLVDYLHDSAQGLFDVTNSLELGTSIGQLVAFKRWKGDNHLPAQESFDELLEKELVSSESPYDSSLRSPLSSKKRKAVDSLPTNLSIKRKSVPTKLSRVGECNDEVANKEGSTAIQGLPYSKMLSKLCMAAKDPFGGCRLLKSFIGSFSNFRNAVSMENFNLPKVEQENQEKQVLSEPEREKSNMEMNSINETSIVVLESQDVEKTLEDEKLKESCPVTLVLKFSDFDAIPSVSNLNNIFSQYGVLNEAETEVLKKSNRAKVVFKKRSDAESAFSSAGKFSLFGPSLVSYKLKYKTSSKPGKKRNKMSRVCDMHVYYEGEFINGVYEGGYVEFIEIDDCNLMCMESITSLSEILEYHPASRVFYKVDGKGFENGVKQLDSEDSVTNMVRVCYPLGVVEVFVDHNLEYLQQNAEEQD